MKLSEKYNVPEETIKKMVKDGVISCSWPNYERISEMRKEGKSVDDIMAETGYSQRQVYNILNRIGLK